MSKTKFAIRRFFQFSLRTILIVTGVVAVSMATFFRPKPSQDKLPDGAVVRYFERQEENAENPATPVSDTPVTIRYGSYSIFDSAGRRLCQGHYRKDQPSGQWTYYHPNGTKAFSGRVQDGVFIEDWTAWDRQGRQRLKVAYGEPLEISQPKGWNWPNRFHAQREGDAVAWWPTGNARVQGQHAQDQREGLWREFDQDGNVIDEKNYTNGRSPAAMRDGASHELLDQLAAELLSDDKQRRCAASAALARIGASAVPSLLEGIQHPDPKIVALSLRTLALLEDAAVDALPQLESFAASDDRQLRLEADLTRLAIAVEGREERLRELLERSSDWPASWRAQLQYRLCGPRPDLLALVQEQLESEDPRCAQRALDVFAALVRHQDHFGYRRLTTTYELLQEVRPTANAEVLERLDQMISELPVGNGMGPFWGGMSGSIF